MIEVAESLIDLLGRDKVFSDEDTLSNYAVDGLRPSRAYSHLAALVPQPLAVVRPASSEEVAAVVRFVAEHDIALVPFGGGSGLMGGAIAVRPSIIVDLSTMNRIIAVSCDDRTATVEAGVILADLERELNRNGLILGHDPWSLPIATVGGAISTDGLGYRSYRYGSMGDQVLGLIVVLADGRVLRTRAVPRHSTGPDLNRLFIGGEGCFGIITEATLRVFPQPEQRELMAYLFADFETGFAAIIELFQIGLRPSLLEFGESNFAATENDLPVLYLGFEGLQEEVKAQAQRAATILANLSGKALEQSEAQQFWDNRHRVAERYARSRVAQVGQPLGSTLPERYFDYIHVCLPATKVLEYRRLCAEIMARYALDSVDYGLWCQPELFSTVMVKATISGHDDGEIMARAVDEMLSAVHKLGGSMEYCHGVGVRLAHLMAQERGEVGLEVLRSMKRALDPRSILNSGKLGL